MTDRWIELHDGTIINLKNIVKVFTFEGKWILFDTSGLCTDISESDRKRIMNFLNESSCLKLLTNQKNNPEKEYLQVKLNVVENISLIKEIKEKRNFAKLYDTQFSKGVEASMNWILDKIANEEDKND